MRKDFHSILDPDAIKCCQTIALAFRSPLRKGLHLKPKMDFHFQTKHGPETEQNQRNWTRTLRDERQIKHNLYNLV